MYTMLRSDGLPGQYSWVLLGNSFGHASKPILRLRETRRSRHAKAIYFFDRRDWLSGEAKQRNNDTVTTVGDL